MTNLREQADKLASQIVGTVAWPYFKKLDATTSAKEQDRLAGQLHVVLRRVAEGAHELGCVEGGAQMSLALDRGLHGEEGVWPDWILKARRELSELSAAREQVDELESDLRVARAALVTVKEKETSAREQVRRLTEGLTAIRDTTGPKQMPDPAEAANEAMRLACAALAETAQPEEGK